MQNSSENHLSNVPGVRMDLLNSLPLELLISIFAQLPWSDRRSCLCASRAWRNWMLKVPQVWWYVEVTRAHANAIYNLLPKIGRHIEVLVLNFNPNRFMTPMARGVFKSLKTLKILANKPPGESHMEHDLCLNALRKVSTTLTDLHIDFKLTPAPPTFTEIRVTCPNLVKLGYHVSYFKSNQAELNSTATIDTSKLVELDIGTNKAAISIVEMNALLQQYPDLKKLTITKFPYQHILNIVPRHIPNLEFFKFNRDKNAHYQDDRFPETLPPIRTLSMHTGKLTSLILMEDDFATPMPWDALKSILEQAAPTLQQLHCCFHFTNPRFTKLLGPDPPQFDFPELTRLKCSVGEGKSQKYVASLICNAPKLVAVTIRNYARVQRTADQILDALISLESLTWLELLEQAPKPLNGKKLIDLFKKHAGLKNKAPLQYVSLSGLFVTSDILLALAKVTTLRGVDIGSCGPLLDKFIRALKRLPHFHEIHFMNVRTVTNETLPKFAQLTKLKKVVLLACKKINDTGLYKLLNSSQSLKVLEISKGTARSSKFEEFAKGKLEKLSIDPYFDDSCIW
ncbi:hypothetical protein INT45_010894 [Circinella minor]|uniref:F-box domain-containing protein n=1 Tax=Circinella minor TaxID=1195481 RepID=A0A8H7VLF3_9FUNG|nr:hypothetical protein INT45_010894 [Circinella minor]